MMQICRSALLRIGQYALVRPSTSLMAVGSVCVLLIVVSSGCSRDGEGTTTVDGREVFIMKDADCDDGGACALGWTIDDRLYLAECRDGVPEDGGWLYAIRHPGTASETQAWTVPGHDPSELLFVPDSDACDSLGQRTYAIPES